MLGATDTTRFPEAAPEGIVNSIYVLLQRSIVTGTEFSKTTLPPCTSPKPAPNIVTRFPTDPVVAETLVIVGAEAPDVVTDTLSSLAVASEELDWLLAAKPMYTFWTIVTTNDYSYVAPTRYRNGRTVQGYCAGSLCRFES